MVGAIDHNYNLKMNWIKKNTSMIYDEIIYNVKIFFGFKRMSNIFLKLHIIEVDLLKDYQIRLYYMQL